MLAQYNFAYITGCFVLLSIWLIIFVLRRDLRKEMIWASVVALPFGFIDYFLIPQYWQYQSIFVLLPGSGLGIESFLFIFSMGGIASVLYEFFFAVTAVDIDEGAKRTHPLILIVGVVLLFVLMAIFPNAVIYDFIIATAIGAGLVCAFRPDLIRQVIITGFIFGLMYFLVFFSVIYFFNGFVEVSYNLDNILGIFVFGVPLEEILAGFFAGAFWSGIYEYTKVKRESNVLVTSGFEIWYK